MSLIHPEELSSIHSLDLRVKAIVEGFLNGLHKSPYHGFSAEFSEYRNYYPGDPTKTIDWKVFAKTDKLMIKKFEADTNLTAIILFDISASMGFGDKTTKLDYVKNLSSAISYLLIKQSDSVGICQFNEQLDTFIEPKTGKSHFNRILHSIDSANVSGDTNLESVFKLLQSKITKRGLVIIFSDLLDEDESFLTQISTLRKYGHDVIVFHIMDRAEAVLDFDERTKFIDLETNEEFDIHPDSIREKYKEKMQSHLDDLTKQFYGIGVEYYSVYTDDYYEHHLLEFLNKRSRL